MSKYLSAEIKDNILLQEEYYLLIVALKENSDEPKPGQFYMIETGVSYDPLLKRPFSIMRYRDNELHFLYRVKGKGTMMLRQMKKGDSVKLIGPLGHGYPLPKAKQIPLLIAGGTGIASLWLLAEKLSSSALLFYGARTQDEIVMLNELKTMVKDIIISTDDGTAGTKCTVVDSLNSFIDSHPAERDSFVIYACGPEVMLKAVAVLAKDKDIQGYVSVEEKMACGIGACLGCAVQTKNGFQRACSEGPVFSIEEVAW